MDLRDFLSWFDGFAENIPEKPTKAQWERMKERVAKLREAPMRPTVSGPPTLVKGISAADEELMNQIKEIKTKRSSGGFDSGSGGGAMDAGV